MRRILVILSLLITLTVGGMVGLRLVTGASWLDCLYFAVITMTTVGFSETIVLDDSGRLFIIFYLIFCLGIFTYSAFQLGQLIFSAQLRLTLEKRRMNKAIHSLRNHHIVCGQGRMGETICQFLDSRNRPFVVIDTDRERLEATCNENGWLFQVGDATDDDVLRNAGIEHASALASVLATDADNVYVVLSARLLAPDVQIVARASEPKAIEKLERAGATRVVSPFSSGATKMARFMVNPNIANFLEVTSNHGAEWELADIHIAPESHYVGMKLLETDLRDKGVMVIGIRRTDGEHLMPPPGTATIEEGDCLFAFGSSSSIRTMIEQDTPT